MPLFNINNNKLENIKHSQFKLERELQTLTEQNLQTVFGLEFVRSEFSVGKFRIDTLAFDRENKSFVIIEYKRDKSYSVIDQGLTYLSLMLNNKADFILEYNENCEETLKRDKLDWSQSRVLFISTKFTPYQQEAINFKALPIELWVVTRYSNKTISYDKIQTSGSKESINTITDKDEKIKTVTDEIKVFTEEQHLENVSEEIKELYEKLKIGILNLADLDVKARKHYIAFIASSHVADIQIQQKQIKIWLNLAMGDLDDPKQLSRDVSATGHLGNGAYEITMKTDEDLEYILSLIKQSLNKNKK